MKGIGGLILALAIGIIGAFSNWFYLAQKSRQLAKVSFIGISENRAINAGDLLQEADFVPIEIPAAHIGYLEQAAYRYSERQTVAGMTAPRAYGPGEILLRLDVRTPPQLDIKKMLGENERVMWIPVDTRSFVASLVQAGDNVSFLVPKMTGPLPVSPDGARPPAGDGQTEIIGPFRILALGNRMGSVEVMRAAGMSPAQENVMAVSVKLVNNALDDQSRKLSELLRLTNFQQVQVLLHPDANKR
jgi:Flp pilus assembly protein CpaB